MRSDMAKVVTERPRYGHHAKSNKTSAKRVRNYDPSDDGDAFEKIPKRMPVGAHRQHGYGAKEFSDHLNPLKKYLRKQIGRPWNKIHSELSAKLDRRSMSGRHIWQHIGWEVTQECYIGQFQKSKLAFESRMSRWQKHPSPVRGLYVNPANGLLCENNPKAVEAYNTWVRAAWQKEHDAKEARRVASLTPTERLLEKRRGVLDRAFDRRVTADKVAEEIKQQKFKDAVERHPEILKILKAA